MKKVFIITRKDLENGARIVQSVHSFHELARKNEEILNQVYNTICYKIEDELSLKEVSERIASNLNEKEYAWFRETDYNNQLTSFAVFTNKKELFKGLRLA
ncbi:MAG: hypothetical protein M0P71_01610 [Melioribacteraceae bacterium]|nr:hypothetical protein [Melioribacteraceae bacterium]